jgi:hypothetical protein
MLLDKVNQATSPEGIIADQSPDTRITPGVAVPGVFAPPPGRA